MIVLVIMIHNSKSEKLYGITVYLGRNFEEESVPLLCIAFYMNQKLNFNIVISYVEWARTGSTKYT